MLSYVLWVIQGYLAGHIWWRGQLNFSKEKKIGVEINASRFSYKSKRFFM